MLLANFHEQGFPLNGLAGICVLKAHPSANLSLVLAQFTSSESNQFLNTLVLENYVFEGCPKRQRKSFTFLHRTTSKIVEA